MFYHHKWGKRTYNNIKIIHAELREKGKVAQNYGKYEYCALFFLLVYHAY